MRERACGTSALIAGQISLQKYSTASTFGSQSMAPTKVMRGAEAASGIGSRGIQAGGIGAILREIDSSGDDGNAIGIHPLHHDGAIVGGDGNHMLELADYGTLVAEHLAEFHAVDHLFCRVARSGGMAAPDFAFHVVLEEDAGDVEASGKVDRRVQEVADGDIEALLAEPVLELLLDLSVSEAADRIWRMSPKMSQIVERARGSRGYALTGADGHRAGQLALQLALVVRVGRSSIVGVKRELMPRGQISQDV